MRRIAVFFSRLSGYMAACLREVEVRYGVELLVVRHAPDPNAPFAAEEFGWIKRLHDRHLLDRRKLLRLIDEFQPDGLYLSGWFDRDYLAAGRYARARGIPVVAGLDGQWKGTYRQYLGKYTAAWNLHPAIDVLWAAGERQRQFAAHLGYRGRKCWSGVYACDVERFAAVFQRRAPRPGPFVFVGRYVPVKGLDVLVEAYRTYRRSTERPWPLVCAGTGSLASALRAEDGISDRGFVQPRELPSLLAEGASFILPSRHEPWGVVLQEAAATGLPLIASNACGAAVHLLQDGYNGYLFQSEDAGHLARCLLHMSDAGPDEWNRMSAASYQMSLQFTPGRWATTLVQGLDQFRTLDPFQSADARDA